MNKMTGKTIEGGQRRKSGKSPKNAIKYLTFGIIHIKLIRNGLSEALERALPVKEETV